MMMLAAQSARASTLVITWIDSTLVQRLQLLLPMHNLPVCFGLPIWLLLSSCILFVQQSIRDGSTTLRTVKDVGIDSSLSASPSRWPIDFEKMRQEIIQLWHECNAPIVHRTYFFLLFKGDPADNIYMEVEHRRLSFIRRSFSASPAGGELNSAVVSRYIVTW